MATFLLADNQDITRFGFHYLLDSIPDRTTEFEAIDIHTRSELLGHLKQIEDAIIVLDYSLFDINSIDELLNIAGRFPTARWILFSEELSETFIRRLAIEQNFSMLLKDSNAQELLLAVRYNLKGDRYLCHNITNLLLSAPSPRERLHEHLTATEIEVLKLIAQGKSVKEIAAERISSIHTITTHKKNIFRKLEVSTIYEATKYALRAGLVEMAEYYI